MTQREPGFQWAYEDAARDIVAFWGGLTKAELWSLDVGDVHTLMDMAVEKIDLLIEALRDCARLNCFRPWMNDDGHCGECTSCRARIALAGVS